MFVWITLVSTRVLIFSSSVQLSEATSPRGRSEELVLQLFVSRGTYAEVGTCREGKGLVWVLEFCIDILVSFL